MDFYIKIYQKGDRYNTDTKGFNVRQGGGAASREYAKWILKTDRGITDKEANKYLDMLVIASKEA